RLRRGAARRIPAAPFLGERNAVEDVDQDAVPVGAEKDDLPRGVAVDLADGQLRDRETGWNRELGDEAVRGVVEHVRRAAVVAAAGRCRGYDQLEIAVAVEIRSRRAERTVEIDAGVLQRLAVGVADEQPGITGGRE